MRNIIFRLNRAMFNQLTGDFVKAGNLESQAFWLCSKASTQFTDIYLPQIQILPDQNELQNQSGLGTETTQHFQASVYSLAYRLRLHVFDIHTHPFSLHPQFSMIDDCQGQENVHYFTQKFPPEQTMGMVVFGQNLKDFEARIWNRQDKHFDSIDSVEILGSPIEILTKTKQEIISDGDLYARHSIIPGWDQNLLEDLKVFVCGLGGNGSLVFQILINLGIGKKGWLIACDPDVIETSNIPRIPFAQHKHVGLPKALLAKSYAKYKNPTLNVHCYQTGIENKKLQKYIKEAHVFLGCVDKDGPRQILNSMAARYYVPYIDLGTEIIRNQSSYESAGQIRTFIPGQSGCLMCSGIIDPSEAALDQISWKRHVQRRNLGYIRGTNETPNPSVMHLNGITSHLAASHLLYMVFGAAIQGKDFIHYGQNKYQLLCAAMNSELDCPVCGIDGKIGIGDPVESMIAINKNTKISIMPRNKICTV